MFRASVTNTSLTFIPILADVSKKSKLCLFAKAYPWSLETWRNSSKSYLLPTNTIETERVSMLSLID